MSVEECDRESLPKECRDEIDDIGSRAQDSVLARGPVLSIESSASFYHLINEQFWPADSEKPEPRAFHDPGLSVYVEGGSFGKLNLKKEVKLFCQRMNWKTAGAVRFSAVDILDKNKFKFCVKHDPHCFRDRKTGDVLEQSPVHAQIICKKGSQARMGLLDVCEPILRPGEDLDELEPEVEQEKQSELR